MSASSIVAVIMGLLILVLHINDKDNKKIRLLERLLEDDPATAYEEARAWLYGIEERYMKAMRRYYDIRKPELAIDRKAEEHIAFADLQKQSFKKVFERLNAAGFGFKVEEFDHRLFK